MFEDLKETVRDNLGQEVEVLTCEGRTLVVGEIDSYDPGGFWIRVHKLQYIRYDNVNEIVQGGSE